MGMTLDEAIRHAEEVAIEEDKLCKRYDDASGYTRSHNEEIRTSYAKKCEKCATEHRQLVDWLKDYKKLLEQEPCDDCISRAEAIKALEYNLSIEADGGLDKYRTVIKDLLNAIYNTQKKAIEALPSIQPQPKTGHWIEDDMTYCGVELVNYKCDKCGEMCGAWRKGLKPDKLPKYCMNCGAKMLPTDSEKE